MLYLFMYLILIQLSLLASDVDNEVKTVYERRTGSTISSINTDFSDTIIEYNNSYHQDITKYFTDAENVVQTIFLDPDFDCNLIHTKMESLRDQKRKLDELYPHEQYHKKIRNKSILDYQKYSFECIDQLIKNYFSEYK